MNRFVFFFFLAVSLRGQSLDPAFAKIPFSEWMEGRDQAHLRWSAKLQPPILSAHQRFLARVDVTLDGVEVARRRGKGEFVVFFQLIDAEGKKFQDHGTIDLAKIEEGIKGSDLVYTETAFVLPGDYRVSLAIYSTATGEHSVKQEKLHIAPFRNDPLPHAWDGLPSVEFRPEETPPSRFFQPAIHTRLNLDVETRRPTHVDVLVNLTPSERASASQQAQDVGLSVMLPALKVLGNIEWRNTSLDVTLLDLLRQSVLYRSGKLEWEGMRASLAPAEPGKIDVKSLENRRNQAAFFVSEVEKRLAPEHVVVVLSGLVSFESGEDLTPIHAALPAHCRVYYFRFHPPMVIRAVAPQVRQPARRGTAAIGRPVNRPAPILVDQLEATLKPLEPRLFDIETPEQFRAALSSLLRELSLF